MSEPAFMQALNDPQNGLNGGMYFPFINDCHTGLQRAFGNLGVPYPADAAVIGRFGDTTG